MAHLPRGRAQVEHVGEGWDQASVSGSTRSSMAMSLNSLDSKTSRHSRHSTYSASSSRETICTRGCRQGWFTELLGVGAFGEAEGWFEFIYPGNALARGPTGIGGILCQPGGLSSPTTRKGHATEHAIWAEFDVGVGRRGCRIGARVAGVFPMPRLALSPEISEGGVPNKVSMAQS